MLKFKTKKEAEERLEELRKEMGSKLCPLINRKCACYCMAYYEGGVRKLNEEWKVYQPFCTSPIITGEIGVNT